jgi:hypothetical protein
VLRILFEKNVPVRVRTFLAGYEELFRKTTTRMKSRGRKQALIDGLLKQREGATSSGKPKGTSRNLLPPPRRGETVAGRGAK